MKCPVCGKEMTEQTNSYFVCMAGDGVLVSGRYLLSQNLQGLKKAEISGLDIAESRKNDLTCPNCQHKMQKTNYNDSGIVIDSCTNCSYRWIDEDEVKRFQKRSPGPVEEKSAKKTNNRMRPEDILFVDEINQKIGRTDPETDINPRIPYFNLERALTVGNEDRTLGAILGNGIYGIIKGLMTSWFMRIAILIIAVVAYIIYRMATNAFK